MSETIGTGGTGTTPGVFPGANGNLIVKASDASGDVVFEVGGKEVSRITSDGFGSVTRDSVPTPWHINHRGAPVLYPECTLEGYRAALSAGGKVFQIPFYKLKDGSLGVMHDSTLDRTTTATGNVADQHAGSWQQLVCDCTSGSAWFSTFPDSRPPFLEEVLSILKGRAVVILEGKNAGTGAASFEIVKRLGMLKSVMFETDPTNVAEFAPFIAANVPCSYQGISSKPTPATVIASGAIGCNLAYDAAGQDSTYIASLVAAGLFVTVSLGSGQGYGRRVFRDSFLALGVKGLYVEDYLYTSGNCPVYTSALFGANASWLPGMIPASAPNTVGDTDATVPLPGSTARGQFVSGRFAVNSAASAEQWSLLGFLGACNTLSGGTYTLNVSITFDQLTNNPIDTTRWPGVGFCAPDDSKFASTVGNGYYVFVRENGQLQLFKMVTGTPTQLGGTISTTAVTVGTTIVLKIDVTPTTITVTRTDAGGFTPISSNDTTFRSAGYVHVGKNDAAKGGHYSFGPITRT